MAADSGFGFGDGLIYTSTNSGAIWVADDAPSTSWTSVASAADGNNLLAVNYLYPPLWVWLYSARPLHPD